MPSRFPLPHPKYPSCQQVMHLQRDRRNPSKKRTNPTWSDLYPSIRRHRTAFPRNSASSPHTSRQTVTIRTNRTTTRMPIVVRTTARCWDSVATTWGKISCDESSSHTELSWHWNWKTDTSEWWSCVQNCLTCISVQQFRQRDRHIRQSGNRENNERSSKIVDGHFRLGFTDNCSSTASSSRAESSMSTSSAAAASSLSDGLSADVAIEVIWLWRWRNCNLEIAMDIIRV